MSAITPIDNNIYLNPTINIAILGCISSGKSTLMNSLFAETYSSMNIKRTTMCPQVYCTDKRISSDASHSARVKAENDKMNKRLYEAGKLSSVKEMTYTVPSMPDIFSETINGALVEYKIYDIPGLNDGATKETFYSYITNNFYKFDVIVFNIDINSGLNTTDEIDILTLIKTQIDKMRRDYGREPRLIVVCNKCDDLYINDKKELVSSNEEIEGMYEQVSNIVKKHFPSKVPILKYSASNTYVYRCVAVRGKSFRPEHIDKIYINRLGEDNFGRVPWQRMSAGKSIDAQWELVKDKLTDNIEDSLLFSGFQNLRTTIGRDVIHTYIYDLMYSKINYHKDPSDFETRYTFITKLNLLFKCNYGEKQLNSFTDEKFNEMLRTYNPSQQITDANLEKMKKYKGCLDYMKDLSLHSSRHSEVLKMIEEYNTKFADYLLRAIETTNSWTGDWDQLSANLNHIHMTCGKERIIKALPKLVIVIFNKNWFGKMANYSKPIGLYNIFADNYLNHIDTVYDHTKPFNGTSVVRMEKYYEHLLDIAEHSKGTTITKTIEKRITNYQKQMADYDVKTIGSSQLKGVCIKDLIFKIDQIIKYHGIEVFDKNTGSIYNGLINLVNIDDVVTLVNHLTINGADKNILVMFYMNVIARYFNSRTNDQIVPLVKNYINKIYFQTDVELFNLLYCSIVNPVSCQIAFPVVCSHTDYDAATNYIVQFKDYVTTGVYGIWTGEIQ